MTGVPMQHQQHPQQPQRAQFEGEDERPGAALDEGYLVGWLVIYDESGKGKAREIRSGKFFIGGAQLRNTDYVIAHHSVSTPHCLAHAVPGEGLKLLDLMSKRGTAVKRKGTNAYVAHNEMVTVSHGDWVRFGQFEALVCLVPVAR